MIMMSIDSSKIPTKAVYLLVIIFSSFYPAGVVSSFDVKLCSQHRRDGSCFPVHSVSLRLFIGELRQLMLRDINE